MIFTFPALGQSLADCLAPGLPGAAFYANPNQQGTRPPALFLRQTNASIARKLSGRYLRRLGLDLVYLERPNIVDTEGRLQAAADVMDQRLDTFLYRSGPEETPVFLRTYGRRWEIADSTLHYKFDLRLWLTCQEDAVLMESIQAMNREIQ